MLGISWYEYLVIAIVALIVIGPKELPAVLRAIGQWTAKIQRMAAEFRGQFQEAMREAEMADLKKEVDNIGEQARSFTSHLSDPVNLQDVTKWEPQSEPATKSTTSEPSPEAGKADNVVKPIEDTTSADSSAYGEAGQGAPAAAAQPDAQTAVASAATPPSTSPEGSAPKKAEEGVHS
jgi:sec-independent protein translocase protein TatB